MYIMYSVLYSARSYHRILLSHIQAWASALPSNSNRQCEKPPIVGRATSTDSHAFYFLKKCNQERRLLLIIKMDNTIYQKSFIFEATQFEEYQDGLCLKKGTCNTTIIAKVLNSNCIAMLLQNEIPVKINQNFGLPIFGSQSGDVLEDRIQYGRIPDTLSWHDSNEPVVCNIFNNHTCIRFAMMSPMRIVEFYGKFTDIRTI